MVLMAHSECKIANVPIWNKLPKMLPNFKFCITFGKYIQLITIHWIDQTDIMAQQM